MQAAADILESLASEIDEVALTADRLGRDWWRERAGDAREVADLLRSKGVGRATRELVALAEALDRVGSYSRWLVELADAALVLTEGDDNAAQAA